MRGPIRPLPESFKPICDRYEIISYRSGLLPIELKIGGDIPCYVCSLQLKFHGVWISGLRDIVDTRWILTLAVLLVSIASTPSFRLDDCTRSQGDVVRAPRFDPLFTPS